MSTDSKQLHDATSLKKEEMKQDMKEMDDEELIASAMSGDKIKELLSSQGPSVKAVLLKSDGSVEEIIYDSTPSRNHVSEILGAPPSIIGQYPDLDVIVVGPRYQESQTQFKLNKHKLRFPFNDATFYGDIFLYRFNQECVCVDFTADEYKEFAAKSNEDIGKVFEPLISDDQDPQDDDNNEYDQEEDAQYAEEFMREIIINKVKKEYPEKFGREPTEQELEDMVNATLSMFAGAIQEEQDEDYEEDMDQDEDEDDDEYDPNDDQHQAMNDEILDIPNDEELKNDKQDIEEALNEEAEEVKDVLDEDEEKLINSEHFENELISAIEMVQNIAKFDKEKILSMTKELYQNETGLQPTNQMMNDALKLFTMDQAHIDDNDNDEDDDDDDDNVACDNDNIDGEEFKKEMEMALENVRKLGSAHQKEFVNQICKTYTELNGVEPTQEQISGIFGRIKEKLADEAREQFLEDNNNDYIDDDEDDKNDDDYVPNEQDIKQVEDDKKMDLLEELVEDNETENNEKVKILVTPVKKRLSGSRVDIYLRDQKDTNKTLDIASSKFEQINGRAPNENDTQRLKEFLSTGMLFESQVNASKINENGEEDDDEDEDDEDEEYDPTKDTFDYSKDIEDDTFDVVDENEDTSNMIDID